MPGSGFYTPLPMAAAPQGWGRLTPTPLTPRASSLMLLLFLNPFPPLPRTRQSAASLEAANKPARPGTAASSLETSLP